MGESSTFNTLRIKGRVETVGGVTATVLQRDADKNVLYASGLTIPTSGATGYAKGCVFIKTNASAGVKSVYENKGTSVSAAFSPAGLGAVMYMYPGAIATTGATSGSAIAPETGVVEAMYFSGKDALATNDTNYVVFTVVNKEAGGAGTTAMLAASDENTTKVTGGSAIGAYVTRALTLHGTAANLNVVAGDRLEWTGTVTGTLANTVTGPQILVKIRPTV